VVRAGAAGGTRAREVGRGPCPPRVGSPQYPNPMDGARPRGFRRRGALGRELRLSEYEDLLYYKNSG